MQRLPDIHIDACQIRSDRSQKVTPSRNKGWVVANREMREDESVGKRYRQRERTRNRGEGDKRERERERVRVRARVSE